MAMLLPERIAGEAVFSSVSAAYELGIMLVLIGAFTSCPIRSSRLVRLFAMGYCLSCCYRRLGDCAFFTSWRVIAYRRDVRIVTGFASLLLLLVVPVFRGSPKAVLA